MNLAIITLSEYGLKTTLRIRRCLELAPSVYAFKKNAEATCFAEDNHSNGITYFPGPIHKLVNQIFKQFDGFVFVMAAGIVARVIAPHIQDKLTDPAVVVVDDVGRFVISLLSGHEGGANQLAHRIAAALHTDAVITTGTEARKDVIVGIGCKKGIHAAIVKNSIIDAIQKANLRIEQVRLLATIDIKSKEQGLLQAAGELGIPLRIVSTPEIASCAREYCKSDFVKEKIGVGGVCEPAALIAGRKTQLILTKQKYPGMTLAIARENFMW